MEKIFKALAEKNRLKILAILVQGELCVCQIEKSLKLTQSNASRHLNTLKNAGIVSSTKQAQWIYYQISTEFKQTNKELWKHLKIVLKQLPTKIEKSHDC